LSFIDDIHLFYPASNPLAQYLATRESCFGQYDAKFFTTVTGNNIYSSYKFSEHVSDFFQNIITSRVAIIIIHFFKKINIDQDKGNRVSVSF